MNFTGQYQMPSTGYNFIVPYIYENKLKVIGPPIDQWLDNPGQRAPDSCRTEIMIPVGM